MVRKILFWGLEIEKETMVMVAETAESLGSTVNMPCMSGNLHWMSKAGSLATKSLKLNLGYIKGNSYTELKIFLLKIDEGEQTSHVVWKMSKESN